MTTESTDRELTPTMDDRYMGKAYLHAKSGKVFIETDTPDEEHNCDEMGCATIGGHIIQWLVSANTRPLRPGVREVVENIISALREHDRFLFEDYPDLEKVILRASLLPPQEPRKDSDHA